MNKFFIVTVMVFTISIVSALACAEQVHVEDENGADMQGVVVVVSSDCGWGPKTNTTDTQGWTYRWGAISNCNYTAEVPTPPDGYTCDTGWDYNPGDDGKIYLHCTPVEVPEFGLLAGGAALLGALIGFAILRRR